MAEQEERKSVSAELASEQSHILMNTLFQTVSFIWYSYPTDSNIDVLCLRLYHHLRTSRHRTLKRRSLTN